MPTLSPSFSGGALVYAPQALYTGPPIFLTTARLSMPLEDYVQLTIDFVRTHEVWAAPIVALLAFGESLAFISLLIPAWGALVGIGALIGPSEINFWPIWVAGSIGAALGDWLSY